jgi:hypothetical protein
MVIVGGDEHLRLVPQPAEGDAVDDAVAVALEGVAQRVGRHGMQAAARARGVGGEWSRHGARPIVQGPAESRHEDALPPHVSDFFTILVPGAECAETKLLGTLNCVVWHGSCLCL